MFLIKKVSEISGVSVRTLHHYDEIGLLSPKKNEKGYRYYSEDDMSFLQMILFYKYLGFPLKQIKELLKQEDPEILYHLKKQLVLMQKEKQKLLTLIDTLEKTIESRERKFTMSTKEKFKGFTYQDNEKYKQKAIDLYGKEVIEEAVKNADLMLLSFVFSFSTISRFNPNDLSSFSKTGKYTEVSNFSSFVFNEKSRSSEKRSSP
ncbi:MerR family transcriptional regulator [Lachnoanaerobaculum sp.]|uniref:MerR family transcriptional regulator n=1 Tax=Lachnoanaerobaculum sp. TaxID=2049030 RepID=UPI002ED5D4FD